MPIKLDRTGIFGWSQNIKVPISLRIPTQKWRKNGVEEPAIRSCENCLLQHYQQYLSCPAHKQGSFFIRTPAQRTTRRFTSHSAEPQRPARNISATGSGHRTSSAFHKTRRIVRWHMLVLLYLLHYNDSKTAWRRPPVGRHAFNCWEWQKESSGLDFSKPPPVNIN